MVSVGQSSLRARFHNRFNTYRREWGREWVIKEGNSGRCTHVHNTNGNSAHIMHITLVLHTHHKCHIPWLP